MKLTFAENLRIVWAITSKDLIDALKNKNVLSLIITSLFVVIMYRYLPLLTAEDGPPALLVYDDKKRTGFRPALFWIRVLPFIT